MKPIVVFSIAALTLSSVFAQAPGPKGKDSPKGRMEHKGGPGMMGKRGGGDRPMMKMGGDREKGMRGGPEMGPLGRMAGPLNLTDEQKAKAKEIMEATKPKVEAIREEEQKKIQAVMDEAMNQIRPELTADQQAVFDALIKVREEQRSLDEAVRAAREAAAEVKAKATPTPEESSDSE